MLITNLQKQLVLFLNLFKKTWVTGTFVCVETSGREYAQDKIAAYQTLYTCLLISKLGRRTFLYG
jgi:hypothetical protein